MPRKQHSPRPAFREVVGTLITPDVFLSQDQRRLRDAIQSAIDEGYPPEWEEGWNVERDQEIAKLNRRLSRPGRPRKPNSDTAKQMDKEWELHVAGYTSAEIQRKLYPNIQKQDAALSRQNLIRQHISRRKKLIASKY